MPAKPAPSGRSPEIARDRRTVTDVEKQPVPPTPASTIAYDDFAKVDVRAGTVIAAAPLPNARKPAFALEIDFGPEIGIKHSSAQVTVHYVPGTLIGRQVAAVVNFAPKRIAGVWSEVLVLGFPDQSEAVVLVGPSLAVPNGARLF